MPERITLSRAKGWRKPEGAIVVARPSIWGNPWGVGSPGKITGTLARYTTLMNINQQRAVWLFQDWLVTGKIICGALPDMTHFTDAGKMALQDYLHARRMQILANLDQLRGHDLCCWCKPGQPCHADVLLRLANV